MLHVNAFIGKKWPPNKGLEVCPRKIKLYEWVHVLDMIFKDVSRYTVDKDFKANGSTIYIK